MFFVYIGLISYVICLKVFIVISVSGDALRKEIQLYVVVSLYILPRYFGKDDVR